MRCISGPSACAPCRASWAAGPARRAPRRRRYGALPRGDRGSGALSRSQPEPWPSGPASGTALLDIAAAHVRSIGLQRFVGGPQLDSLQKPDQLAVTDQHVLGLQARGPVRAVLVLEPCAPILVAGRQANIQGQR